MNISRGHVDRVMDVVRGDSTLAPHPDVIRRSWMRCVQEYGLDPSGTQRMNVEVSTRLRERRERHDRYLRAARAGMEQLYRHLPDLGYVLMLADADGVTLEHVGDPGADSPIRASLVRGAHWSETHAGTNGIGTCLVERRTLSCHRNDHFYAGNLDLSCTATPLYDPCGTLMGALDASAIMIPESARANQHLVRHLTSFYGRLIEDAVFMSHFKDHWVLKLSANSALLEVSPDMLVAFDSDGVIAGMNSGARRTLELLGDGSRGLPVGHDLRGAFRTPADEIWRLARGAGRAAQAPLEDWHGNVYHATVRPPRCVPARNPARCEPDRTTTSALRAIGGEDSAITRLMEQAGKLAARPINILIQGETGTGKEFLARALHSSSPRADEPFVAINCAAIPESLIESELFGYQPGTFTGARSRGMVGLIQRADGGTLFLDEIGDMPLALQTRLLRVLSEGEVLPLGADRPVALRLTVIAASHQNLPERVRDGGFREDLYYRLAGATLRLPPLRERQDRGHLIRQLLGEEAERMHATGEMAPQALELLMTYDWPGNIRELRNVLRYALSMAENGRIDITHLPPELRSQAAAELIASMAGEDDGTTAAATGPGPHTPTMSESERLLDALRRHQWVITRVAEELQLCRVTIYRRMKRYGIVPPTRFC